jgi:hypothetical protein
MEPQVKIWLGTICLIDTWELAQSSHKLQKGQRDPITCMYNYGQIQMLKAKKLQHRKEHITNNSWTFCLISLILAQIKLLFE